MLADMGYDAYLIDEEVIYDQYKLEETLRRIFGGLPSGGGDTGAYPAQVTSSHEAERNEHDELYDTIKELEVFLYGYLS